MSVSPGTVVFTLKAIDKASSTMDKVKGSMHLLGAQLSQLGGGFESVGNIMSGFAAAGGLGAVTMAIGEVIKVTQECINTFMEFETALVNVSSASGKTGEALAQLEVDLIEAAKAAGVDFGVGATKAMEAMEALIKAGLEGQDAINALSAALALAKVEGMSTAEAADLLVGILGMFRLSAEEAAHATDVLANASIQGIGTAAQFAKGLSYVGGRADALGFSLEETTAALVAMNNQGINAASAGQYLNQMFTSLITKSDQLGFSLYDSQGQMLTLAEISGNLVDKLNSMATEEERNAYLTQIFGARAGIAANALTKLGASGAEVAAALRALSKGLDATGTAMDIVDAKTDTLAGTQDRLNALMENLQLTVGEALAPVMRFFADIMENTIIPIFEAIIPPIMAVVDGVFQLIKFFFNLGKIIMNYLKPIFDAIYTFLKPLIDVIKGIVDAIMFLFGAIIEGANSAATAVDDVANAVDDASDSMTTSVEDMTESQRASYEQYLAHYQGLRDGVQDVSEDIVESYEDMAGGIQEILSGLTDDQAAAWNQIVADTTGAISSGLLGDAQDMIHDFVECTTTKQADMIEQIDGYLQDLGDQYRENMKKIADLRAQGLHREADLLVKKNQEITAKMDQLLAWRYQLLEEATGKMSDLVASAFELPSRIVPPETDPILAPIGGGPPFEAAPGGGTAVANVTLEFHDPILPFDAKEHAEEIMEQLRLLKEEERRQRGHM